MADDRVHPADSPPATVQPATTSSGNSSEEAPSKPDHPATGKTVPTPGTYVIQIPKDQIFRYPPPENARRFQKYSSTKSRRSSCRRCLCWTLGLVTLLVVMSGIAAGVLYLIFRPDAPRYAVNDVVIRGFNLTLAAPISPEFDVIIRAENPNDKIGIHYEKGSSVDVRYSDVHLSNGKLPAFYQPTNNVTVFQTALRGSDIILTDAVHSELVAGQRRGMVPLRLNIKVPLKFKVGAVKTWTFTVKVKCDVAVDNLTVQSQIVSRDCDYSVKPW